MEAIHKLKVECPYQILKIDDIKIQCKPNEHGYLNMKCLIDDTINFNYAIKASTEDKICIYEEIDNDEDEKSIIFNGLIQSVRTTNVNGVYYLEIDAVTSSFMLDIEEKSRSFQDTEMTYYDVIEEILKYYNGLGYGRHMDKSQKIGKPLFQYKETDYNFIKRLASELGIDMISDIMKFSNTFYFGRPVGEQYVLEDEINYRAYKNLKKYYLTKPERRINFHDTDFFYYEVEKREKMDIGDQVYFKEKRLYVNQFTAKFHQGELIYRYRLCGENGIWQEKIDNEKLNGVSLEGKVLEVKDELIKLHLDIDKDQNQDKAFWFTFAPPTGNIMYSMPIVGTNALLYFPNVNKADPIVIGCVRKNGGSCDKFSDVNKRYYTTEHKNQLAMIPDCISFICSGKPGLSVTLDDNEGVTLKSDKNLTLTAPNEVIMKTDTKVIINGKNKLEVQRQSKQTGISLENDVYCFGGIVHENGSSREKGASLEENNSDATVNNDINLGNILSAMMGAISFVASVVRRW
jgi:hypothetical protein